MGREAPEMARGFLRSSSSEPHSAAREVRNSEGWCTRASRGGSWSWTWCWGPGWSSTYTPWMRPTSAPYCKCSTSALHQNSLHGSIPAEIRNCTEPRAIYLPES